MKSNKNFVVLLKPKIKLDENSVFNNSHIILNEWYINKK
jgi:hypothetical protein